MVDGRLLGKSPDRATCGWVNSGLRGGLRTLAKRRRLVQNCDMNHTMSDEELRRAIRALQDRAAVARKRGDRDAAEAIERTMHDYQVQMAHRL